MDRHCQRNVLVLSRSKWEQMKDKADPSRLHRKETQLTSKSAEYYKALDELSKEWKKNWPDTLEGCIAQVERRKARQRARDLEFVKAFEEKERQSVSNNRDAVAQAKQKIFDSTCYGVQLISALRESKDIELREAQIEYNKYIKRKEEEHSKYLDDKIASMPNNMFDYAKKEDEAKAQRKLRTEELAKYNKNISELKAKKEAEKKEQERLGELEDAMLQQMTLDYEKHEMDHCKRKAIEEALAHQADQRTIREEKRMRDEEDSALVEAWQRYHHRVWCGEKRTLQKTIKEQGEDSLGYKICCETIKKNSEDNQKVYDDFVQKGINRLKARTEKHDNEHEQQTQESHKAYFKQVQEDHKTALEVKDILKHCNKCVCERQTWVCKPRERVIKEVKGGDIGDTHVPEPFLKPYTKLSDALKLRGEEPNPYTGLKGQHEQFAKQARSIIDECKYKHMAMKVVNAYKKSSGLDSAALLLSKDENDDKLSCYLD